MTTPKEARTTATTTVATSAPPRTTPRNTRNEIIAIALLAFGLLIALCLLSFNPNDASWNVGGQQSADRRNFVGAVGANIAQSLFQFVGLAAYLLPVLLFAAAWRRFRTRRLRAPLLRVIGLLLIVVAISSLLALFAAPQLYDRSFEPGGLIGAFVAYALAGSLNTIGASVLLFALAAAGLLLATNFSFVQMYERLATGESRIAWLRLLPDKFKAWRTRRRAIIPDEQPEMQPVAIDEQAVVRKAEKSKDEMTLAERAAAFMRETENLPRQNDAPPVDAILTTPSEQSNAQASIARAARAAGGEVTMANAVAPPLDPLVSEIKPSKEESTEGKTAVKSSQSAKKSAIQESPDTAQEAGHDASIVRTLGITDTFAESEEQPAERVRSIPLIEEEDTSALQPYTLPDVRFLNPATLRHEQAETELRDLGTRLTEKYKEFNVTGRLEHICPGPVVTTYEFKPDPGVKYSRVTGLVDDLCLALKAEAIRIDRVPGKAHVGIEVPNPERETIALREVIESRAFRESPSKLTIALGKTIDGLNYVADLAKMPHLLIAGATGTGKSVCLNTLVVSMLYKATPDEVKFIMVDPKRLELGLYADIPHLATPIITEPKRAANALKWAVKEMEERYKTLAKWSVRNIDGYNSEVEHRNSVKDFDEKGEPWKPLPYIVIMIDELADLMMTCGHDVEEAITRLAQMARAVGIHLILATQRPSVDVITGLIKANFPSRISFRVSSKVDSRTIIDANGAEQLLGRGDMLFLPPGTSRLIRVHGAFLDEQEVARVVNHIKSQSAPTYDETITQSEDEATGANGANGDRDELFEEALRICVEMKRASTSVLQRRLRIGYGRAAAILDSMEREGLIGQADGARPRAVTGKAYETIAHWDDLERGESN
jgi:DNA segregation ATPase FtsK/SpoIIIE, S-DNA-T family